MELALSVPLPGIETAETVGYVQRAAERGYRAVWASEVAGPDFASLLGAVAATCDLDLGVAVIPTATRSPWLIAATAATLSQLSGGCFTLGLGTSSELIVEQWSGVPFERPLQRLRECTEVVRGLLDGERVAFDGELLRTRGYRLFAEPPARVPIVLGALGPRATRMAGELADGVCLNQLAPEHVRAAVAAARAGAEAAGRGGADLAVVARLFCWVTDDVAEARNVVRRTFAPYAATSVYNAHYRRLGFVEEAEAVATAFAARDRAAAAAALSDALVDAVFVIGDAEAVSARVAEYVDAGVTVPVIAPMGSRDDLHPTVDAIAAHLA